VEKKEKLKRDMLRSICKQSEVSMESVLKKKKKVSGLVQVRRDRGREFQILGADTNICRICKKGRF